MFESLYAQEELSSLSEVQDRSSATETHFGLVFALALMVVAVVAVGIYSSSTRAANRSLRLLVSGPSAQNLFLGIQYLLGDAADAMSGYLRSLSLKEATLVTTHRVEVGVPVQLLLGSLPGFPNREVSVGGKVIHCKAMDSAGHFTVRTRFDALIPEAKAQLVAFLEQLGRRSRSSL